MVGVTMESDPGGCARDWIHFTRPVTCTTSTRQALSLQVVTNSLSQSAGAKIKTCTIIDLDNLQIPLSFLKVD